jgi:hypothetical protein
MARQRKRTNRILSGRVHVNKTASQRKDSDSQIGILLSGIACLGVALLVVVLRARIPLPFILFLAIVGSITIIGAALLLYYCAITLNPQKVDAWFSLQNGRGAWQGISAQPPSDEASLSITIERQTPPTSERKVIHLR